VNNNRYNEDAMSAYRRRSAIEGGDSSGSSGGAELGVAAVILLLGFLVYALFFC
jgi:hypothetical protein